MAQCLLTAGSLKGAELSVHAAMRQAHPGGLALCPHLAKGGYLVSGGLAEGAVCCQVFRIPHAGLVASLLEQRKEHYIHTHACRTRGYLHTGPVCRGPSGNRFRNGLAS